MEEFNKIEIQHICSNICSGGTPKSTVAEYYGGNTPWLNTKEINFRCIYETEKTITEEGLNNSSAKWIPANSVIVAMYGATAGKTAITKIPLTTNQACCNLTIDSNKADYRFVFYALCNNYAYLASLANGGAQQNLNAQQIKELEIPYPSLEEQKKIADILTTIDDKIELNCRINDNLEQQAQALFKSWFVDFEPFRDGEFVDSGLGMIPEGWSIICFNDFLTPSSQRTLQENIPEYSVTNTGIIPRDSKFKKQLSKSTSKNKILRKNNLVFGMSREILNWGIMYDEIGSVSSAYNVYIIDDLLVSPTYLKYYMTANIDYFKDLIGTAAREGQALDKGALVQKQICIPPYEILDDFLTRENGYKYKVDKLNSEIINLTNMRDLLLPKLMSGELKINDLNC